MQISITAKGGATKNTIIELVNQLAGGENTITQLLNEWAWEFGYRDLPLTVDFLKRYSPLPVEEDPKKWPKKMPHAMPNGVGGIVPCTDGATIWMPSKMNGRLGVGVFLHELAHTYLHFPDGPNIELEDPWLKTGEPFSSVWEAEVSAVAYIVQMICEGEPDCSYNIMFLKLWTGDENELQRERIMEAVGKIIEHYSSRNGEEDV